MAGIFKWRSTNKLVATLAEDLQALLRTNKELIFNERDLQVRVATWLRDSRHYDEVDMEYHPSGGCEYQPFWRTLEDGLPHRQGPGSQ